MLQVKKDGPAARTLLQLAAKQLPNAIERYQVRGMQGDRGEPVLL